MSLTRRRQCRSISAALVLAAVAVLAGPGTAGATSLILRGSVDPDCNVSIQDLNANLNIRNGETSLMVGRVREYCNDKDGFTLSFRSTNGGALVTSLGSRAPYELSYEDAAGFTSMGNGRTFTRNKRQTSNTWRDVYVRLPAQAQAIAGDYWDTITVTITAR